jgi:spermidine export protein MdtJ
MSRAVIISTTLDHWVGVDEFTAVGFSVVEGVAIPVGLVHYAPITLSYLLLAKAARTISIGIAFALWEGLGIALITAVSVLFLGYELSIQEWIGLALAIVGIVMVTLGETHDVPAPTRQRREAPCTR